MKKVRFGELPFVVRLVWALALFNLWWSTEEFVIDRFGVWRYLPDYKFGRLFVWDLTVALAIFATTWWLSLSTQAGSTD